MYISKPGHALLLQLVNWCLLPRCTSECSKSRIKV